MRMLRITGVAAAAVIALLPAFTTPAYADAGSATITGHITEQSGAGADATVTAQTVDGSFSAYAYTTPDDGSYRIENVPAGDYKISISDNKHGTQWMVGAETIDDAKVFAVADGQTLVADDRWLPGGTVRVVVGDAVTGKPVPKPCARVATTPNDVRGCGKNGVVVLTDVPPGDWQIEVSGGASYFTPEDQKYITVKRSRTTKVITTLEPGAAIRAKVVDNATGAPLGLICVNVVDATWSGRTSNALQTCSTDDGVLEVGPFADAETTQTMNLYAYQGINPFDPPSTRYGDQWVGGAKGGTGDQRKALKIKLTPKVTKTIPAIRMDPPGTITGVIRDSATGAPVRGVCSFPTSMVPFAGFPSGKHCSNADGRYTIDDVGPYAWPVEFAPSLSVGYAWQWSGDVADRYAATYVPVTAGGSVTVDAALTKGGTLTGTVTTDGEPARTVLVFSYNRKTRDFAGPTWSYTDGAGLYKLPGYHGGQKLWVYYQADGVECWYGTDTTAATPVAITDGVTTTLDIDTKANCAPKPTAG